jgi:hypothetical protein
MKVLRDGWLNTRFASLSRFTARMKAEKLLVILVRICNELRFLIVQFL